MYRPHVLPLMSALATLFIASGALATPTNAIYEGSTLQWNGSLSSNGATYAPNKIVVYNGTGIVNGATVSIAGQYMDTTQATPSNFAWDQITLPLAAQNANSSCYVYYAQYVDGGGATKYIFVISGTSPYPEGYPSANLKFTYLIGQPAVTTSNALFMGSYMTDKNKNIIPFHRMGQSVILYGPQGAGSNAWSNSLGASGGIPFTSTSCASSYPCVQYTNLTGLTQALNWPASADGLIVNITATTTGAAAVYVGILDNAAIPAGGATAWLPALLMSPTSTSPVSITNAIIPYHQSNQVAVGDAIAPAATKNDTINITLVGYTEVTNRL